MRTLCSPPTPIPAAVLTAAIYAARAAADAVADDGACNLDSTFILLDKGDRGRWLEKQILATGLRCHKRRWIGMRGIMVTPPNEGQAGKRSASNQAFCDALRAGGVRAITYMQMD